MSERVEQGAPGLKAYQVAVSLTERVAEVLRRSRCSMARRSQLERCSDSTVLNTAEGAAHFQPGKKIYHYELAKGSAEECRAALHLLHLREPHIDVSAARRDADTLCALLVGLIKSQEKRRRGDS